MQIIIAALLLSITFGGMVIALLQTLAAVRTAATQLTITLEAIEANQRLGAPAPLDYTIFSKEQS